MRFSAAAAIFSTLPLIASAAQCTWTNLGRNSGAARSYVIFDVAGVTDPNGLCNGLRDNIHGFGACTESGFSCRMVGDRFEWFTTVPIGCNEGMIEAVWWGATQNKFGGISC
jgi:hypothetical protein